MLQEVKTCAAKRSFSDGESYRGISVEDVAQLSKRFRLPGKAIEIAALEVEIIPERYARNMKSYTLEDQAALLKSTVSVVGLGGLGVGVTAILAHSGVGTLRLIDGDRFEDHNLNRHRRNIYDNQ